MSIEAADLRALAGEWQSFAEFWDKSARDTDDRSLAHVWEARRDVYRQAIYDLRIRVGVTV